MKENEFEQRKETAADEVLVIVPTDGGFRVYSPANITRIFMVSGIPDSPQCNCADFEGKKSDPEWRCKHIGAVLNQLEKRQRQSSQPSDETPQTQERPASTPKASEAAVRKKSKAPRSGQQSQMMVKRSVSPDGRINSLSVKFLNPINGVPDEEIKQQAERALKLQAEIVSDFLKRNGSRRPEGQFQEKAGNGGNLNGSQSNTNPAASGSDGAVLAQLLNIAGMNTRGGWKTFINVQVNGTTTKVFGTKHELGELITAAGFASISDHISQGMMLNLPCRVVTKRSPDGRYLNIERVLPVKPLETSGRAGQ
jgi:hypothetical protein